MLIEFYHFNGDDSDDPFVNYYWDHAPRDGDTIWLPPEPDGNRRVPLEKVVVSRIEWQPHSDSVAAAIYVAPWSKGNQ